MPLYLYKCDHCDHEFEKLVRSDDRDKDYSCPTCGKTNSKRVFTSFSTYKRSSDSLPPCAGSTPSCAGG